MSLVGGAWIVLHAGPRTVFLIYGGLTLVSLGAALLLPRLPREAAGKQGFRLPVPHRLETWGFMLGFASDGVFLLTLAFLMKDSITSVAPVMATALLLALRWLVEITTGPLGGWIGDRFGARPHRHRQRRPAGRGLRADRARSRGARGADGRHDPRHVQHADPGTGDRARPRRACCPRRRAIRPGAISAPPSARSPRRGCSSTCRRRRSTRRWLRRSASAPISAWSGVALAGAHHWFGASAISAYRNTSLRCRTSANTCDRIAAGHADGLLHGRHVGAQERVGLLLLAEQ